MLGGDSLIGTCELSVSQIYSFEEHSLQHMWIGLVNHGSTFKQRIRGFVKVSMNIYGEEDD